MRGSFRQSILQSLRTQKIVLFSVYVMIAKSIGGKTHAPPSTTSIFHHSYNITIVGGGPTECISSIIRNNNNSLLLHTW